MTDTILTTTPVYATEIKEWRIMAEFSHRNRIYTTGKMSLEETLKAVKAGYGRPYRLLDCTKGRRTEVWTLTGGWR